MADASAPAPAPTTALGRLPEKKQALTRKLAFQYFKQELSWNQIAEILHREGISKEAFDDAGFEVADFHNTHMSHGRLLGSGHGHGTEGMPIFLRRG